MGKGKTAKTSESKKTNKKAKKSGERQTGARPTSPEFVAAQPVVSASEDTGRGYSLAQVAAALGPPDRELEALIREAHSDDELQAKGAKIASDRIVEDGERLCSGALLLLQSQDDQIKEALTGGGLTPSLVALLVDGLLRLDGTAHAVQQTSAGGKAGREASAAAAAAAVAQGKRLRLEIRERLERAAKVDAAMKKQLAGDSVQPTSGRELATQLDTLARLVEGALSHHDKKVQGLARLRGLSAADATALTQAARGLRKAEQGRGSDGRARATEQQAQLDVQDGYCLLLIGELLGALRNVSRRTRKVRRPTLYRLRSYFLGSHPHDEDATPVPPVA